MSPRSFHLLAAHSPDAAVAVGAEGEVGVEALLRDVAALSAALPGSSPGSEVLILCTDRYRFAASLLAAWQRGHVAALPPNAQAETVRLLAGSPNVAACLHDGGAEVGIDARAIAPAMLPAVLQAVEAGRTLVTIYSSGSTGREKACSKTALQLLGEAELLRASFSIGPRDRVLATVPPHHLYGLLFGLLVPLVSGAAFARSTPLHAEAVAAEALATSATVLVSVPAHLRSLAPPPVRLVFSSSAPLEEATARRIVQGCPDSWEILGSTETGGIASRRFGAELYRPLDGVKVTAAADGQLLLDSPLIDAGLPLPHACADRIELFADGSFRHLGRADDVVKIGGKRVALSELERRLRAVDGVDDAAAVAVAVDSARGAEIHAAVASSRVTAAQLRHELLKHFDPTLLPRRLRVVADLPRSANGKLSRSRLLALFEDGKQFPVRELSRAESPGGEVVELGAWRTGLLTIDGWKHMLLPAVTLSLFPMALVLRLVLAREERAVTFSLERAGTACSSGTLEFGA